MIIELTRCTEHANAAFGFLSLDGEPFAVTLEPAWKNNLQNESCIPEGEYDIEPYSSLQFGQCFEVRNVANRQAILIHPGNTREDTKGCILIGKKIDLLDGRAAILESTTACMQLRNRIEYPAILRVRGGCTCK